MIFILIKIVIFLLLNIIINSEILLATDHIPSLFLDGPQNESTIYSLRSNINQSNIIIRYHLDNIDHINNKNNNNYNICMLIKRYNDRYSYNN